MGWLASPAETEATCIWKVSPQLVVGIFLKVRIMSRIRDSFCERNEEYDVKTIYKLCCSLMAVGV